MMITAVRCDFCKKVNREVDKGEVPNGWAVVSAYISIKGTPKGNSVTARWVPLTKSFSDEFIEPEKVKIRKLYDIRRDALRKKMIKTHVCEDCIEEILTGKVSLKLGHNGEADEH